MRFYIGLIPNSVYTATVYAKNHAGESKAMSFDRSRHNCTTEIGVPAMVSEHLATEKLSDLLSIFRSCSSLNRMTRTHN